MTKLTTWQATIQDDDTGAAIVSPVVTIRLGGPAGTLADLFDIAGSPLGVNPVTGGLDGFVQFQVRPGRYWVQAADGGTFSNAWYIDVMPEEGLSWETRSEFVTDWAAGMNLPDGTVVSAGGVQYEIDSTATAISDLVGVKPFGRYMIDHWGENTTPGTTDMTAALQAAVDYVKDNTGLIYGRGEYRITDTIDLFEDRGTSTQRQWGIEGDWSEILVFINDIQDHSKALFDAKGNGTRRWVRKVLRNFSIDSSSVNGTAMPFRLGDISGSLVENIRMNRVPNTLISADGMANDRWKNVISYGGGYPLIFADTSIATVSGTVGTNTLTVAGYTATAGLIGKIVNVEGGTVPGQYTVTAVPDPSTLTVTPALEVTYSGAVPIFVPQVSGTSAGFTATADCDCFDAEMIGIPLCIRLDNSNDVYRGVVTAVPAANQVTFDTAFPVTFSDAYIASPVIDMNGSVTEQNDIILENLHIEDYSGVGIYAKDITKGRLPDFKTHGYTGSDADRLTIASMWLQDCEMVAYGLLESDARGPERIFFSDQSGRTARFPDLQCALKANASIFTLNSFSGNGAVVGGDIAITGTDRKRWNIVNDANSVSRFALMGVVEAAGEETEVVGYIPENTRLGITSGVPFYEDGNWTPKVADASTGGNEATISGQQFGRYVRIGNQVTVWMSVANIDKTGLTGVNDVWITGLPFTSTSNGADFFSGALVSDDLTFSGDSPIPYLQSSAGGFRLAENVSASSKDFITVNDLNATSTNLRVTLTYATSE